jgi:hypothetical protein
VHVARPQLGRKTISLLVEQQQRMKTGGLEVPVVSALLLLAVDGTSVESISRIVRYPESVASALPIRARLSRASPAKFSSGASISVSKLCNREVRAAPRSQIFSELISRKAGFWESLSASLRSS